MERYGLVAYQLDLPNTLAGVHNVFYVSQLKKCLKVPMDQEAYVIEQLQPSYPEHLVRILD